MNLEDEPNGRTYPVLLPISQESTFRTSELREKPSALQADKIVEVPYRKGRREKSSAEPQLQEGGLLIRGFWLPDAEAWGVALHPEFASLGYALAGFVTDASGPRRGNHALKVNLPSLLSTTQRPDQVDSPRWHRKFRHPFRTLSAMEETLSLHVLFAPCSFYVAFLSRHAPRKSLTQRERRAFENGPSVSRSTANRVPREHRVPNAHRAR